MSVLLESIIDFILNNNSISHSTISIITHRSSRMRLVTVRVVRLPFLLLLVVALRTTCIVPPVCQAASLPLLPPALVGDGEFRAIVARGGGESIASSRRRRRHYQLAAVSGRQGKRGRKRTTLPDDEEEEDVDEVEEELTIQRPQKLRRRQRKKRQSSLWPPWPFNMLQGQSQSSSASLKEDYDGVVQQRRKPAPFLVWLFARESTRMTLDKIRQVGSQLWFHLPPGMPPFVLMAMVPRTARTRAPTTAEATAVAAETVKKVIPLFANSFVRSVALSGLGMAIMSWAHYEIHRKRSLTPLPLKPPYRDLYRTVLPPFLPEENPAWRSSRNDANSDTNTEGDEDDDEEDPESKTFTILPRNVNSLLGKAPTPQSLHSTLKGWQRMRTQRRLERQRAHRLSIQDQLLALQALKSRAQQRKKKKSRKSKATIHKDPDDTNPDDDALGCALVTGASRGIGRAIAVELARYEIPLILVARDTDRLTALAYDLECCYGVKCCVIAADLSKPGEAEKMHKATSAAGLKVDVLVNNAGYSLQGESMDFSIQQTENLIQLNAMSLSALTHLYGKDMKERRRGRILMVSSICGAVAGIPSVAVYAATKSFVNTLSLSIALELEPYGVGVTCVMPGAVKDTEFKSRSDTDQALCWKIPFYPKTPQRVAESGVKALLRGETQCTPGWENRFFLKVLKPAVPQRIHNIIAEIFWNPFHLPFRRVTKVVPMPPKKASVIVNDGTVDRNSSPPPPSLPTPMRAPRLLQLEDDVQPDNQHTQVEDKEIKREVEQAEQTVDGDEDERLFESDHASQPLVEEEHTRSEFHFEAHESVVSKDRTAHGSEDERKFDPDHALEPSVEEEHTRPESPVETHESIASTGHATSASGKSSRPLAFLAPLPIHNHKW